MIKVCEKKKKNWCYAFFFFFFFFFYMCLYSSDTWSVINGASSPW